MTPETLRQYKADISRNRYERDAYKKRASFQRQEYLRLKKARRFLDALHALERYQEYRNTAARFGEEAARLRGILK